MEIQFFYNIKFYWTIALSAAVVNYLQQLSRKSSVDAFGEICDELIRVYRAKEPRRQRGSSRRAAGELLSKLAQAKATLWPFSHLALAE